MNRSQKPLSPVQKKYYLFMAYYLEVNHCLPSMLVVAAHFNVNVNAVNCIFARLCEKGYLEKSAPESGVRAKYKLGKAAVSVEFSLGNEAKA